MRNPIHGTMHMHVFMYSTVQNLRVPYTDTAQPEWLQTQPLELRNLVHGTVHVIMYSTVHSPSGKVLVMLNGIAIEKSNSLLPECRTAAA